MNIGRYPRTVAPRSKRRGDVARAQAGFSLIEVLVALAIVGFALAAAARATGMLAGTNGSLRDRSLALISAKNRMTELQVDTAAPPSGTARTPCPQGPLSLTCETRVSMAQGGSRVVTIEVYRTDEPQRTLASLRSVIEPPG
ncbi:general secretion pathway protein I [Bordetella ansorpii]|jgi:general secretion pathway protein I|uniref:Type II secretion system protein I n=1 Tax=Bordetella ansorpii TaxID=288768 RepID=A0A157QMI3_9BORD|nr:type II secretion system minor pseudopilin GspI [Bordetella ansorpii]SAI46219.1 general secretion pathway protein I [Bordetella ansorpii]